MDSEQNSQYRHLVPRWEEIVEHMLRPDAVSALTAPGGPATQPQVFGRLVTLAHVKDSLNAPFS